jgi:hypothetical protein
LYLALKLESIPMALNNNDIFKKLRVALQLRDDEIVKICALVDFKITTTELGALFRNETHPKYMECGDQILRNFLNGLVIHMRGPMPTDKAKKDVDPTARIIDKDGDIETRNKDTRRQPVEEVKIGNKVFKRKD